ncbi:MAG: tetratricopeptide repeat protein, partial [Planctomycetota bacterium]|nr:tetratricopeptide repeat protein [Planctomycetota bacterium]
MRRVLDVFLTFRTFCGAARAKFTALAILSVSAILTGIGLSEAEDFHDTFEAEKPGAGWEFDASRNYPGAECKGGPSGLELKAAASAYILMRRSIDAPGTDASPLVVTARLRQPQNAGWDPCLALWWEGGGFIALAAGRDNAAYGRAVAGDARTELFRAGGCATDVSGVGIWLRMVVSSRAVNFYTSGDGAIFEWRGMMERKGLFAGPPRKLIVGRGWTCAAEGFAAPLLANDHPSGDKTPSSTFIREISVTDRPWAPPDWSSPIEKRDRWADTEAALEKTQALRSWRLIGPIPDPNRAIFAPAPGREAPPDLTDDWSQPVKVPGGMSLRSVSYMPEGEEAEAYVDLTHALGPGDKSTFYAQTAFDREAAGAARLWMDASDPVRLWVNGRAVEVPGAPREKRRPEKNRLAVPIVLRKGRNFVRLKIYNERGECGFYARLEPMDPGWRIGLLHALLQAHPDDPERWRRGEALLEIAGHWEAMHRYDKALEALEGAMDAGPDAFEEGYRRKVALLARLGRWDEFAATCDRAIASGVPGDEAIFLEYRAAWADAKTGGIEAARGRLRRLADRPPPMPSRAATASRLLARVAIQAGDLPAAWRALEEAAGAFDRAGVRAEAAGEYLALGSAAFSRCVEAAGRGTQPDPSDLRTASSAFRKVLELLPSGVAGQVREYVRRSEALAGRRPLESAACLWAAAFLCHFRQDPAIRPDVEVGTDLRLPEPFDPKRPDDRIASDIAAAVWGAGPFADWEIAGPFSEAQVLKGKGTPEADAGAGAAYADEENKPIRWVKVARFWGGLVGITGLSHVAAGRYGVYCYARRDIERPADEQTFLRVSAHGPVAVFVNGKLVLDAPRNERYVLDGYVIPVSLRKGTNRLLVRVRRVEDAFGFTLRLGADTSAGLKVLEMLHAAVCRPVEFFPCLDRLGYVARAFVECGRGEVGAALARSVSASCPPGDAAARIRALGWEMDVLRSLWRPAEFATRIERILFDLRTLPPHPACSEALARACLHAGDLCARRGVLSLATDFWKEAVREPAGSPEGRQAMLSLAANLAYSGMGESATPYLYRLRSVWRSGPEVLEQVRTISEYIKSARPEIVYYDVSPDAQTGIEAAMRQAEHGDTERAVRALQEIMNSCDSGLFLLERRGAHRRYVGVREYIRYILAGEKERPVYLRMFSGDAEAAMAKAVCRRDPDTLRRAAFNYYLTPAAGRTLNLLGNIYMDEGKYDLAMTEFRRV